MRHRRLFASLSLLALACFASCSSIETAPRVAIAPNSSGIEIGAIKQQGPSYLIGKSWNADGTLNPPDIPPRTTIEVKRIQSLHNKEPRYFIPASGVVQVVSVVRYSDYPRASDLPQWRELLNSPNILGDEEQQMLSQSRLQEIPWMNAARCFHGKLRKRRFPWGDAVLFLTSYAQGPTGGPVNNDMLVLVAQGLTTDGRYAVKAHFEIRHPRLPDSSWDERRKGKAVFSIDEQTAEAERWLDSQPDDAFSPTFGQYERFLSALQITTGTPSNKPKQMQGTAISSLRDH